jgi:hypothetical protein
MIVGPLHQHTGTGLCFVNTLREFDRSGYPGTLHLGYGQRSVLVNILPDGLFSLTS